VPDFQPGDVFAGHRIDGVAGRGGMGVVYRALQLDLERPVALKLIAPSLAEDPEFRDRFVRESRAAASIDHPNVIPIYYTGEHDGLLYIAMRYVEGSDLRTLVRAEGRLEPERAARIVAQVGAALDAAHARGLVHRDVKPANVLLGAEDHAYLTDFGLTKRLHSAAASTHAGGWVGTLGYVAPEQIRGGRVDARADVYALGCVLFHALSGAPPYQRERDEGTLWAHLNDPPPSVASIAEVPEAFDEVLRRAMAKDPADRYPSAGDLGRAALLAAGAPATIRPERTVAVGAAAPGGDEETVVSADQSPTRMATRRQQPPPPATAPPRTAGRPRSAWLLALLPVVALVVAGIVLLGGGGDDGTTTSGDRTGTVGGQEGVPAPAGRVVGRTGVGGRPNDIVVAAGSAWVLRGGNERVAILNARTGKRRAQSPFVGGLPASATAGFGKLWVARQRDPALVAFGLASRRRTGAEVPLGDGGDRAVAVAAGENACCASTRAGGRSRRPSSSSRGCRTWRSGPGRSGSPGGATTW
jgi:Protein kinase domain